MQPSPRCPRCGSGYNPAEVNYCPRCGQPLSEAAQPMPAGAPRGFYDPSQGRPLQPVVVNNVVYVNGKKRRHPLRTILLLVVLIVVIVSIAAAANSTNSSQTQTAAASPVPTQSAADTPRIVAAAVLRPTEGKQAHRPVPMPTVQPKATAKPSYPAQQMAHLALGYPVPRNHPLVRTFVAQMAPLQRVCQMHQFQVAALLIRTWRTLTAEGAGIGLETLATDFDTGIVKDGQAIGSVGCGGFAADYVLNHNPQAIAAMTATAIAIESQTATPVPSDTPTDTPTPNPFAQAGPDTYNQVDDHPDMYVGATEVWTCVIDKFLGDDPNTAGNIDVGCNEYVGSYDGIGDGEVILNVPSNIDTSPMDKGDYLQVAGKVDQPWQGVTGMGVQSSWPQLDTTAIQDNGPNAQPQGLG